MKKKEKEALGTLIVLAIFLYPFFWLHEKIGWTGFVIVFSVFIVIIILLSIKKVYEEQKAFDDLALRTLNSRMNPEQARRINLKLAKSNPDKASLIRNLQIMRDSIDIALSSKKRKTAESRMALVCDTCDEIREHYTGLVSSGVFSEIEHVVQEAKMDFQTRLYLNLASEHIDKAETLVTKKARLQRLDLARKLLEEGMANSIGSNPELQEAMDRVEQMEKDLE